VEGHRRIFDIDSLLLKQGFKELDCEGLLPPIVSARVPQAVLDAGVAVFDYGELVKNGGDVEWVSHWTGIYADNQFYISAPETLSSSSKQSLVSLLSIAESFGCGSSWVVVDRKRQDFIKVVSVLKYLGFRLSQSCIEDIKLNTSFALLRYEM
jgi:hypothetical protein